MRMFVKAALVIISSSWAAVCQAQGQTGWQLERDVDKPSYVFTSPKKTDLDIDTLVLTCNEVAGVTILQMELYPVGPLPLIPPGAATNELRRSPHLQLAIDGRVHPVSMYFADDHILVADTEVGRVPAISRALVEAMVRGEVLTLRFQLLVNHYGGGAGYDGEATVELHSTGGAAALAAMRECAFDHGVRISRTSD